MEFLAILRDLLRLVVDITPFLKEIEVFYPLLIIISGIVIIPTIMLIVAFRLCVTKKREDELTEIMSKEFERWEGRRRHLNAQYVV